MNRNSMLNIFTPMYSTLFPFLNDCTAILILATEQLNSLLKTQDPGQQCAIFNIINDQRYKGQILTYNIYSLINRLFITPFNKEEMKELVLMIGDIQESVINTGRIIYLYNLSEIYYSYVELSEIICQAAIEVRNIVMELGDSMKNRNKIAYSGKNLLTLEKRANEIFYNEVLKIIVVDGTMDQIKKKKTILEMLIKCIRETIIVAETTRLVLIKSL